MHNIWYYLYIYVYIYICYILYIINTHHVICHKSGLYPRVRHSFARLCRITTCIFKWYWILVAEMMIARHRKHTNPMRITPAGKATGAEVTTRKWFATRVICNPRKGKTKGLDKHRRKPSFWQLEWGTWCLNHWILWYPFLGKPMHEHWQNGDLPWTG